MSYIATVELLLDVETEAEAMDCVAEALRPLQRNFMQTSSIVDWKWADNLDRESLEVGGPIPADFVPDNDWPYLD